MTDKALSHTIWFIETAPNIFAWPRWLRRLFLFTLPVSLLFYIVMLAIIGIGVAVGMAVLFVVLLVASIWDGKNYLDL